MLYFFSIDISGRADKITLVMGYLNDQLEKEAALKLLATAARKIPAGIRAGARGLNTMADKLQPMMRSGVSTMNTLRKRLPGAAQMFTENIGNAKRSLSRIPYNARNIAKYELPIYKQIASDGWNALKGHASNAYKSLRNGEGFAAAGSHLRQGLKSTASHLDELKEQINAPWGLPKITGPLQSGMRSLRSAVRNPLHHISAGFRPEQLRSAAHMAGMAGNAAMGTLGGIALGKYVGNYITNPTGRVPAAPQYWRG